MVDEQDIQYINWQWMEAQMGGLWSMTNKIKLVDDG